MRAGGRERKRGRKGGREDYGRQGGSPVPRLYCIQADGNKARIQWLIFHHKQGREREVLQRRPRRDQEGKRSIFVRHNTAMLAHARISKLGASRCTYKPRNAQIANDRYVKDLHCLGCTLECSNSLETLVHLDISCCVNNWATRCTHG